MLNMHPAIHVPVELGGLYSSLPQRLRHFGDLNDPFHRRLLANELAHTGHLGQFDEDFDRGRFEQYLIEHDHGLRSVVENFYRVLLDGTGKSRIGDKTPDHMPYFDSIVSLFPDARIVHLVRDGRDCALSSMAWRSGVNFRNTWELAQGWGRHNAYVSAWGRQHSDRYLLVRYEDLVDNTEDTLRQLSIHLGEVYDPTMLEYHRGDFVRENASRLGHHANLTRDIMRGNHGKWVRSMPDIQLKVYEGLAGDELRAFGYSVKFGSMGWRERLVCEGWRFATWCRRIVRKGRQHRNGARFVVALAVKRRLRIHSLRDAMPALRTRRS